MGILSSILLKKSLHQNSKLVQSMQACTWLSKITFHICFATNWVANFRCHQSRIMLDIVYQFLRTAIWSVCAGWLEPEQRPLSRTDCIFRSAALHRILFEPWGLVPMPYLYSETNEWLKDCAKQWVLLWSVTCSRELLRKFHFKLKTKSVVIDKSWFPDDLQGLELGLKLELFHLSNQ